MVAAAVATAISGLLALVLYLYKRYDRPEAGRARRDSDAQEVLGEFDHALGEADAETVTRMFSELDDNTERIGVRPEDGDNTG